MPFPSAACQTCKLRRIKCDETWPECRRCIKAQRICYGLKSSHTCPDIHIENIYASGQKKRPRGPRSAAKVEPIASKNIILYNPTIDLKTRALTYYFHYHLQPLNEAMDLSKCVLSISDHSIPLWMSKSGCPILDHAVSSMALAVFSRTQYHPPAAIEAFIKYQKLLQMTQLAISSLNKGNVDDCLIAIFFMSRYEEVIYRPNNLHAPNPNLKSYSHHDGSLAVLKLWKNHISHSQPASNVVMHTRRGLIRSALLRKIGLPEWMRDGTDFGEHGLDLMYDRAVVRITNLRARLLLTIKQKAEQQVIAQVLEELYEEARDLDTALQDWSIMFPSTWRYHKQITPNSAISPPETCSVGLSYSSPSNAAIWSQYYATRMLVISTRLKILRLINFDLPNSEEYIHQQRLECLLAMNVMAENLASSVPFCLQKVEGKDSLNFSAVTSVNEETMPYMVSMIAWPLTIAAGIEDVESELKMRFSSELACLGRLSGIGVFECAESRHRFEF